MFKYKINFKNCIPELFAISKLCNYDEYIL